MAKARMVAGRRVRGSATDGGDGDGWILPFLL